MKKISNNWLLKHFGFCVRTRRKEAEFIVPVSTVGNRGKLSREEITKLNKLICEPQPR